MATMEGNDADIKLSTVWWEVDKLDNAQVVSGSPKEANRQQIQETLKYF